MSRLIHPEPASWGAVDLSWMVGRTITEVNFHEPAVRRFSFGRDASIAVECPWRILDHGRLVCSGDDHGQRFGLPAPVDAATDATNLLSAASVAAAQLREGSADILVEFSGHLRLEIIPISRGYEGWQLSDPFGMSFVAQGGGQICTWKTFDAC